MNGTPNDDAKQGYEEEISSWLSHPNEFGERPVSVTYRSTVPTKFTWSDSPEDVHLIDYTMPDGTKGVGFTGPMAWSFLGDLPYESFTDIELVQAYTGWLWLFSAIQQETVQDMFEPEDWSTFASHLATIGIINAKRKSQYKIGTSEVFEFEGFREGAKIMGAGADTTVLAFDADSHLTSIPIVYLFLGRSMRGELD